MAAAARAPLDPDVVASLIDLGEEDGQSILAVLADIFVNEEGPACLDRIRAALQCGDSDDLAEGAHKLKGGAAQLGATHLRELSSQLESQARNGDTSGSAALIEAIGREVDRVNAALQAEIAALGH